MNKTTIKLLSDSKKLLKHKPKTLIEVWLMTAMIFLIKRIENEQTLH